MSDNKPRIRWGRGFFRAWVVVSVVWACASVLIFHSEIKYKSSDVHLEINGRDVTVGEEFLHLSREQQDKTVDEIAKSIGVHPNNTGASIARDVTVTFADGSIHVYQNTPNDITPEQVTARAQRDFGKPVTHLDGGRGASLTSPLADDPAKLPEGATLLPDSGSDLPQGFVIDSPSNSIGHKTIIWSSILPVVEWTTVPPIIVLFLGVMIGWAAVGFRRNF